jgi:Xaa-Pro aminopeptidase
VSTDLPPVATPPPPFSAAEVARRRRLVEDCAAERGLDAVVLYGANRAGSAVPWLTGWPVTREAVVVLRPQSHPVLLVGFANHVPNAMRVAVDCDVRPCGESTASTLHGLLGEAERVGVVGSPPAPVRRVLRGAGKVVELDADYLRMRAVKSTEELAHLRHAAWLTDRSAAALIQAAVPGATELDLIEAVESWFVGTGAKIQLQ